MRIRGYVLPLDFDSLLSESEVVFMKFLLFLIYALMASTTINVTLLAIIYIMWTNTNKE